MTPHIGSINFYRNGCLAIDTRIQSVHVEGCMEKSALKPGEFIVTCFVTWRWFDVFCFRNALHRKVLHWLDTYRDAGSRFELRFVENFKT